LIKIEQKERSTDIIMEEKKAIMWMDGNASEENTKK
jgi:hypothetical protein